MNISNSRPIEGGARGLLEQFLLQLRSIEWDVEITDNDCLRLPDIDWYTYARRFKGWISQLRLG